jgi:hypothetical protein
MDQIRIRDPVLFNSLDRGSGSWMNFFWIPDPEGKFFGEIFVRILLFYFFTIKTCS